MRCVGNVSFIGLKAYRTKCLFDSLHSNAPLNIILKRIFLPRRKHIAPALQRSGVDVREEIAVYSENHVQRRNVVPPCGRNALLFNFRK